MELPSLRFDAITNRDYKPTQDVISDRAVHVNGFKCRHLSRWFGLIARVRGVRRFHYTVDRPWVSLPMHMRRRRATFSDHSSTQSFSSLLNMRGSILFLTQINSHQ